MAFMRKFVSAEKNDFVIMSRTQVRAFDAWAINDLAVPSAVLMENAGRSCAELIIERLSNVDNAKVCIFCGAGNNGGDGYVIARHLLNAGIDGRVVICGQKSRIKGDALTNLRIIDAMNAHITEMDMAERQIPAQVNELAGGCDVIVDAIFGTGLKGELGSEYAGLIACINACQAFIMAVDIPSGLDCDTGQPLPVCIEADVTVTFAAVKKGFVACPQAAEATGQIYVASIGVEPSARNNVGG